MRWTPIFCQREAKISYGGGGGENVAVAGSDFKDEMEMPVERYEFRQPQTKTKHATERMWGAMAASQKGLGGVGAAVGHRLHRWMNDKKGDCRPDENADAHKEP